MTRQWVADPKLMCQQHLSGEHLEAHMFLAKMLKGYSLKGFYDGAMFFGAAEVYNRHNELALYLPGHQTPLRMDASLISEYPSVPKDQARTKKSMTDLLTRCEECKRKHAEFYLSKRG